jgi:hypothetical protein
VTAATARPRTHARLRLLAAAAALATAWLATPHAVPLFDGIGVPDEPYRYVAPPAGYQKTPAASSFTTTVPAANGASTGDGFYAETLEQSTQFGVFLSTGALTGPAATKTFTITITPEAPDGGTSSGPINGNMYKVQLLADASTTATIAAADKDSLVTLMRVSSAKIPSATMLYRPTGGDWTALPTQRAGTDSFQAYFRGAGDYAMVATKAVGGGSSHTLVIVVLVFVVLAMVGAVLLIRLSRRPPPGR